MIACKAIRAQSGVVNKLLVVGKSHGRPPWPELDLVDVERIEQGGQSTDRQSRPRPSLKPRDGRLVDPRPALQLPLGPVAVDANSEKRVPDDAERTQVRWTSAGVGGRNSERPIGSVCQLAHMDLRVTDCGRIRSEPSPFPARRANESTERLPPTSLTAAPAACLCANWHMRGGGRAETPAARRQTPYGIRTQRRFPVRDSHYRSPRTRGIPRFDTPRRRCLSSAIGSGPLHARTVEETPRGDARPRG
jgi:hypothetical protein